MNKLGDTDLYVGFHGNPERSSYLPDFSVMRILLVEDEPKVSAFIRRGLEEEGFTVDTAFDGDMGTRLALALTYELVILDVILPLRNGYEVLQAIRTHDQQVPILMLTALGTTQDKL